MVRKIEFIKHLAFLFTALLFCAPVWAEEPTLQKDFQQTVSVPKIGSVSIAYRVTGEPPVQPAVLQISAKCKGGKVPKIVNEIPMCGLRNHKYDSHTHILSISFVSGRVDKTNGDSHCDVNDEKEINLARVCDEAAAKD